MATLTFTGRDRYTTLRGTTQYDEAEVADAWRTMATRLAPNGLLVEGTCDEIGRVSSWIDVAAGGDRLLDR